jgi:hypothetical protein
MKLYKYICTGCSFEDYICFDNFTDLRCPVCSMLAEQTPVVVEIRPLFEGISKESSVKKEKQNGHNLQMHLS